MRTRRSPIVYSEAELAFLEERKAMPRGQLHAAFVAEFDREDVDFDNLKALMKRKGWLTGRTGRIEPGNHPWNTGKKMSFNANSARTRFKVGNLPQNYRGVGHERVCERTGYVMLIVDETNPWTGSATRPVLKHKWMWEQKHGPVPDGMVLKCLDGDRTNTDPSNWAPVPKGLVPRLSHKRGYDDAPSELKPTIMALAKLDHAVATRKHERKEA